MQDAIEYPDNFFLRNGRYRIKSLLSQGGQGQFYLARDRKTNTDVGIKVSSDGRVYHEGRLLKDLNEVPGVPQIYDLFNERHQWHLVMTYLEGGTLEDYIRRRGTLGAQEVIGIGIKLSLFLVGLHSKDIYHCDIKPGNIIISPDYDLAIVDFGIAEYAPYPYRLLNTSGTTGYRPPEDEISAERDIYSLGATLYHAATGYAPHDIPQGRPILRGALGQLVMLMMDPYPDRRPDGAAVLKRLETLRFKESVSHWLPMRPLLSVEKSVAYRYQNHRELRRQFSPNDGYHRAE